MVALCGIGGCRSPRREIFGWSVEPRVVRHVDCRGVGDVHGARMLCCSAFVRLSVPARREFLLVDSEHGGFVLHHSPTGRSIGVYLGAIFNISSGPSCARPGDLQVIRRVMSRTAECGWRRMRER